MKKLFMLCIACMLYYCASAQIAGFNFDNEDLIDMRNFRRDYSVFVTETIDFNNNFKYTTSTCPAPAADVHDLSDVYDSVRIEAVQHLYSIISADICDEDNYVTGIKIWFGFNAGKIIYLYQPMRMIYKGQNRNYSTTDEPDYYIYDHAHDTFILTQNFAALINGYANHVISKKYQGSIAYDCLMGIYSNEAIGDTRYTVFPFQEIADLFANNMGNNGYLYFYNAVSKCSSNGPPSFLNRLKHHLIMSVCPTDRKLQQFDFRVSSASASFSDLGGLCPPDRYYIKYNIKFVRNTLPDCY